MHKLELPCRILLIIHCIFTLMGYVVFIQTAYQLVSPLIPASTIVEISKHAVYASFYVGLLLPISLLLYFFQKRIPVIITSSAAIILYYILADYVLI